MNSGIVAWPAWLIPRRQAIARSVRPAIRRSSPRLLRSTYQTSRANFSSHERELRPCTCAQPVMPGRTSCRRSWRALYRGKYSANSGRGPTRLMSPLRTFQSCGNSSRLQALRIAPTPVSLAASSSKLPEPSRASDIVRNFQSLKTRPCSPVRSCVQNTGGPSHSRIATAAAAMAGAVKASPAIAPIISISRFTNLPMPLSPRVPRLPAIRQHPVENIHKPRLHEARVEEFDGAAAPGLPHAPRQVRPVDQFQHRGRQRPGICRRHDQAGALVDYRFAAAANGGRHHRQSARHGFEDRAWKAFAVGRQYENIHHLQKLFDLRGETRQPEVPLETGIPDSLPHLDRELVAVAVEAVAHNQEGNLAASLDHPFRHIQEFPVSFFLHDARYNADHESMHRASAIPRPKTIRIHAVVDGSGAPRVPDNAGGDSSAAVFVGNEHEMARDPTAGPFDGLEEAPRPPGHTVVKVETVDRVHDVPRARQPRHHAPHGRRHRAVRIDHVESLPAHQPEQFDRRPEMPPRIEAAPQRHRVHGEAFPGQPVEVLPAGAGDVDFVARAPQGSQPGPEQDPRHDVHGGNGQDAADRNTLPAGGVSRSFHRRCRGEPPASRGSYTSSVWWS